MDRCRLNLITSIVIFTCSLLIPSYSLAETTSDKSQSNELYSNMESMLGDNALLTGYGTAGFTSPEHAHSYFSAKFNPIFLYRYKDILLWEAELEFEINSTGGTDTKLEYGSVDWFLNDYAALVAGKFLTPLGFFIRNLHPSWINELPSKPVGFGDDQAIPPEAEIGVQLLGNIPLNETSSFNYAFFAANGPIANVNSTATTSVQTDGMTTATKLYGGRLGFSPTPSFEMGVSAATGRAAFQDSMGNIVETSRPYHVVGADANFHYTNWKVRGEYIQQEIPGDSTTSSGITQGGKWWAYYGQTAYRFDSPLELVIRYGYFSSTQADQKQHQTAIGVDYWLKDSAAIKFAYEINLGQRGSDANANRALVQFAYGF